VSVTVQTDVSVAVCSIADFMDVSKPMPSEPELHAVDPHDWHAHAEDALEKARSMKPGPDRALALKKAGQFQVAADLKRGLRKQKD
jgi:hypothetical protein